MTLTVTSTYSANSLLTACSHASNPPPFPKLFAGPSTPALLCIRVYYYNVNATLTLNVSKTLGISARSPRIFDGASNFTVVTSQNQLVVGGPNNENEGAVMAYAITAKPGASGTYEILFSATYLIEPEGPEQCGYYGVLSAGTGTPNYVTTDFSGCIIYSSNGATNSTKYTVIQIPVAFAGFITGNPVTLINGATYFVISGWSKSTQIGPNG